jgi:SAM-dependent methyltransferase
LLQFVSDALAEAEADAAVDSRVAAVARLRQLGLGDFGEVLWEMPLPSFPRLSSLLPRMAPVEVQQAWTGNSGRTLLLQSVSFVRSLAANYSAITGRSLVGAKILDFGCGYGRMLRMVRYYTDDIYGIDPWDESLRHCREAGLTENLALSEYLPQTLPAPEDLDCIFAFSVFTHLSERAFHTCLGAIRRHLRLGGVACITIRPMEYWRLIRPDLGKDKLTELETAHRAGFAFLPHQRQAVDGDVTYGDTSVTMDWLSANTPGWRIAAIDRSGDDQVQIYVFLEAV